MNLFQKYDIEIKDIIRTIRIYPKDYRNPKKLNDDWYVVYGNGAERKYLRTFVKTSRNIHINKINDHIEKVKNIEFLRDLLKYEFENNIIAVLKFLYGVEKAKELYPEVFNIKVEENGLKKTKLSDALEESLKLNERKSKSIYRNLRTIKKRFLKEVGDMEVENLTENICHEFIYKITKNLENTSFNTYKKHLSILLKGMVKKGYLEINYMDSMEKMKENPKKNKAYTKEQLNKIYELLEDDPVLKFLFPSHDLYIVVAPSCFGI